MVHPDWPRVCFPPDGVKEEHNTEKEKEAGGRKWKESRQKKTPRSMKKGLSEERKAKQETARDEESVSKQRPQQDEKAPEGEEKRSGDLSAQTTEKAEKILLQAEGTGKSKRESETRAEQVGSAAAATATRLFQDAYEARAEVNV